MNFARDFGCILYIKNTCWEVPLLMDENKRFVSSTGLQAYMDVSKNSVFFSQNGWCIMEKPI